MSLDSSRSFRDALSLVLVNKKEKPPIFLSKKTFLTVDQSLQDERTFHLASGRTFLPALD